MNESPQIKGKIVPQKTSCHSTSNDSSFKVKRGHVLKKRVQVIFYV